MTISQNVELFLLVYLSRWISSEVNVKTAYLSILATIFSVLLMAHIV